MKLFAFIKRREGMSREDFLSYWHDQHGPLIRDTPGLGDRTLSYHQYPARDDDRSGWDGVAVQEFASWQDFLAMLDGPAGETMRADEGNFIDPDSIRVVFTDDPVIIVDRAVNPVSPGTADAEDSTA